jgi:hypothetical protein
MLRGGAILVVEESIRTCRHLHASDHSGGL